MGQERAGKTPAFTVWDDPGFVVKRAEPCGTGDQGCRADFEAGRM